MMFNISVLNITSMARTEMDKTVVILSFYHELILKCKQTRFKILCCNVYGDDHSIGVTCTCA